MGLIRRKNRKNVPRETSEYEHRRRNLQKNTNSFNTTSKFGTRADRLRGYVFRGTNSPQLMKKEVSITARSAILEKEYKFLKKTICDKAVSARRHSFFKKAVGSGTFRPGPRKRKHEC